jgi:hypothetical protein
MLPFRGPQLKPAKGVPTGRVAVACENVEIKFSLPFTFETPALIAPLTARRLRIVRSNICFTFIQSAVDKFNAMEKSLFYFSTKILCAINIDRIEVIKVAYPNL